MMTAAPTLTTSAIEKRKQLRSQGVKYQRTYDLKKERKCAACGKPISYGSRVFHNSDYTTFMHFYPSHCEPAPELTPEQAGYIAQITGGRRAVERVEVRLTPPGGFKRTVGTTNGAPSEIWQPGVCMVTPDGQVILPNQPVIPIPACPLLPATFGDPPTEIQIRGKLISDILKLEGQTIDGERLPYRVSRGCKSTVLSQQTTLVLQAYYDCLKAENARKPKQKVQ